MRKQDLEQFRKSLEDRLAKLFNSAHGRTRRTMAREQFGFNQDDPRDEGDEAQRTLLAETRVALSERDAALAQSIENALRRITAGEFGKCIDCGNDIEMARLKLVPWALRCIADQEANEFEGRDRSPSV